MFLKVSCCNNCYFKYRYVDEYENDFITCLVPGGPNRVLLYSDNILLHKKCPLLNNKISVELVKEFDEFYFNVSEENNEKILKFKHFQNRDDEDIWNYLDLKLTKLRLYLWFECNGEYVIDEDGNSVEDVRRKLLKNNFVEEEREER